VRFRVQLIAKDAYVGVANVEQTDPDGNILFQVCARIEGVRLAVESFEPPCQGLDF
jgi:hypothetical protein